MRRARVSNSRYHHGALTSAQAQREKKASVFVDNVAKPFLTLTLLLGATFSDAWNNVIIRNKQLENLLQFMLGFELFTYLQPRFKQMCPLEQEDVERLFLDSRCAARAMIVDYCYSTRAREEQFDDDESEASQQSDNIEDMLEYATLATHLLIVAYCDGLRMFLDVFRFRDKTFRMFCDPPTGVDAMLQCANEHLWCDALVGRLPNPLEISGNLDVRALCKTFKPRPRHMVMLNMVPPNKSNKETYSDMLDQWRTSMCSHVEAYRNIIVRCGFVIPDMLPDNVVLPRGMTRDQDLIIKVSRFLCNIIGMECVSALLQPS